jgi:hypothetical protein
VDERLTRRAQPLVVLGHASVVRDPREGALRAIHLLGSFSKAGRVGNLFLRRRHRLYESPRPAQAILETVGEGGCRARFGHGLLGVGPGGGSGRNADKRRGTSLP